MTTHTETDPAIQELTELVAQLGVVSQRIIDAGGAAGVSREMIAETLYVAARLFSAKTDKEGKTDWPVGADALTATETLVLVTALLEGADINLFDMAIWFRRP